MSARAISSFLSISLLLFSASALAEMTVPVDLQLDLLKRVVRFERGFAARGGARLRFVIVERAGDSGSERVANQLKQALEHAPEIAGKQVAVELEPFVSARALRKRVEGAQIIYLAPGLEAELPAIAAALGELPAITIAADGDAVVQGAVLGFELFSSRPRIVLNLGQAGRQGLDFSSDLARLARVVR